MSIRILLNLSRISILLASLFVWALIAIADCAKAQSSKQQECDRNQILTAGSFMGDDLSGEEEKLYERLNAYRTLLANSHCPI